MLISLHWFLSLDPSILVKTSFGVGNWLARCHALVGTPDLEPQDNSESFEQHFFFETTFGCGNSLVFVMESFFNKRESLTGEWLGSFISNNYLVPEALCETQFPSICNPGPDRSSLLAPPHTLQQTTSPRSACRHHCGSEALAGVVSVTSLVEGRLPDNWQKKDQRVGRCYSNTHSNSLYCFFYMMLILDFVL